MHEIITLSDILRLALPLNTLFVAPAGLSQRQVKWVAVITAVDQLSREFHAGDLIILPANLQREMGDAALTAHLPTAVNLGASALLLFEPVDEQVTAVARELELPLLIVPPETGLREVHQAITALLLNRQAQTADRGMQLYRRLSELSREGQGLEAMIEVMSRLTGKIVVIQDKRLDIRAMSVPADNGLDETAVRDALTQRDNLPDLLRNRKAAAHARQSYWQQLLPIANVGRLVSPIIAGDRARGYLSIIGSPGELDLLDTLTVENGAAACALEMAKAKAVSEAKKELRGNFLEGLLTGALPKKEIERQADRLDHDASLPHAILVFAWGGPNPPTLRRIETTINWLLSSYDQPALTHTFGEAHVCVCQALRGDESMSLAHELGRRLKEQLQAEGHEERLIGGVSGPARQLTDWSEIYQQAVQAMQLGRRLGLGHLVEFNSLGIYQLLAQLEDVPAARTFAEQIIGPLAAYDEQHRSALVETMSAYFNHHGNISQTAESLFIHRNTLLYRLERIQELTGQDLERADMRLAFHLALKLWQLQSGAAN
jgi:PucR family transcriptional regulator, purine catabolism regulatory protein